MVVPFSPGEPVSLRGPFGESELEAHLGEHLAEASARRRSASTAAFQSVHVRSVPKQQRPYPPLAEVIAQQQVSELRDVSGTMMGFCFPDALDGIEMVGSHLHFLTDDRTRGGHVLSYTLLEAIAPSRRRHPSACRAAARGRCSEPRRDARPGRAAPPGDRLSSAGSHMLRRMSPARR